MTKSLDNRSSRDVSPWRDVPPGLEARYRAEVEARSKFPVEIPAWVPSLIGCYVRENYLPWASPEAPANEILVRLTIDTRIRTVWEYLNKRRQSTGRFLRPTRMKHSGTSDPDELQEIALVHLFLEVFLIALCRPRVLLRREVEEAKKERLALADKLLDEEVDECGFDGAKIFREAACRLRQKSSKDPPGAIIVKRDRRNRETRAVATVIAMTLFELFGSGVRKAHYKLAATLATVALDRPVRPGQVREWWKNRPIRPRADKGDFLGFLSTVCKSCT